jgi:hypothetical protein
MATDEGYIEAHVNSVVVIPRSLAGERPVKADLGGIVIVYDDARGLVGVLEILAEHNKACEQKRNHDDKRH